MFWLIPIVGAIAAVFLFSIWDKLPKDIKSKIIEAIILAFIDIFKKYYQKYKNHNNKND